MCPSWFMVFLRKLRHTHPCGGQLCSPSNVKLCHVTCLQDGWLYHEICLIGWFTKFVHGFDGEMDGKELSIFWWWFIGSSNISLHGSSAIWNIFSLISPEINQPFEQLIHSTHLHWFLLATSSSGLGMLYRLTKLMLKAWQRNPLIFGAWMCLGGLELLNYIGIFHQ